ncbi:hypothetical protein KIF24_24180 [Micromonospora sp. Llam7]|uniref:hypothetical protein n=1 Tax=Micromonospora tarapacensis TaxID=2835305 RepID=UPI001C83E2B3|nr:hypothetical protein [Micromonospora tarapacensis]MBX7268811.1 hypothetical protein [Micromonospora tarapacensis]
MTRAPQARAISDLTLAATHAAINVAKLFVAYVLREWEHPELVRDGEDVMAELVKNAVELTGVPEENPRWNDLEYLALLRVRLVLLDEGIVIEVADGHNQPPVPSEQFRSISRRWNSYPTKVGRVVWCELEFQPYQLTSNGLPKRRPSPVAGNTRPAQHVTDPDLLRRVRDGLEAL